MPRLPKGRSVKWKVSLPADLAGRIELELMDKQRGQPVYGLRAMLVRQLLQDWLAAGGGSLTPNEEMNND
jgi:hypothetical protein